MSRTSENPKPMSPAKGLGLLVVLYLLIGGPALWRVWSICRLDRDDCGPRALLDTVLSSGWVIAAALFLLMALATITRFVIKGLRDNTLGIPQEEPAPRFNFNGTLVATVVFSLYLFGSLAMLHLLAGSIDLVDMDVMMFTIALFAIPTLGPMIVYGVIHILNECTSKPASQLLLFGYFVATVLVNYWAVKSTFLSG